MRSQGTNCLYALAKIDQKPHNKMKNKNNLRITVKPKTHLQSLTKRGC